MKKLNQMIKVCFMSLCFSNVMNVSAQSQIHQNTHNNDNRQIAIPVNWDELEQNSPILEKKRSETAWFDYIADTREAGASFGFFNGSQLWPDSNVVKPFRSGPVYNWHLGAGAMFDPSSVLWKINQSQEWTRHTRYTVDSVLFFYKYYNFGEKRDSVVVTFSTPDRLFLGEWVATSYPGTAIFYDRINKEVMNPTKQIVVYLDSTDNTPGFFRETASSHMQAALELPVGLDVTPINDGMVFGNVFGVSVQFFHHRKAQLGEQLTYNDSTDLDPNNLSIFSPLHMGGDDLVALDNSHNYGLTLFAADFYREGSDTTVFTPHNEPGERRQYYYTMFKISASNVGVQEISEEVSFALRPVPAHRSKAIYADFKLNRPGNVRISIHDLQGREVKELANRFYAPGEHKLDVVLSDLKPGFYFYHLETDYGSGTKKFMLY